MRMRVEAGLVGDIASTFKKIFDAIFKGIDKILDNAGLKIKDEEEIEENGNKGIVKKYLTGSDEIVEVKLIKVSDDPVLFDMTIKAEGYPTFEKKKIRENKIKKNLEDWIDDNMGATLEGPIDSSSKVCRVTLQKVVSSDEISIRMTKIAANYDIVKAAGDVDAVLDNEEFVDGLSEDEVAYQIEHIDDEYDVNEINDFDASGCYLEMLDGAIRFMNVLKQLSWGAKGEKFRELRRDAEGMMWGVQTNIDNFAEWVVSKTGVVPNPSTLGQTDIDIPDGINFKEGTEILKSETDRYIDVLETHYINVPHEVQTILDNTIVSLKHDSEYTMSQLLKV